MNIQAIDIETTGLDPRVDRILTIQSYPQSDETSVNNVLHNAFFDVYFLDSHGYGFSSPIYDTMIMHHLIEEDFHREGAGLKELTKTYLGRDIDVFKGVKDRGKAIVEASKEALEAYCLGDATATYELFHIFKDKMKELGTWQLYESIVQPFCEVLIQAKIRGVRIDVSYFTKLQKEYIQKIENIANKMNELCQNECTKISTQEANEARETHLNTLKTDRGRAQVLNKPLEIVPFNWDSNRQVGALLFDFLKLPYGKKTCKQGKKLINGKVKKDWIVGEETLKALIDKHPIVALIAKRRELSKLKRVYIDNILEYGHDGFIHPNLIPITVAGRCKSSEPNIQNIPREGPINKGLIPRDGYKIVKADYAQLELRIAAALSGDKKLCDVFRQGRDPHAETGKALGIERTKAKIVNFALLYGSGPGNLAIQLGYNLDILPVYKRMRVLTDCRRYINSFFATYPDVRKLLDDAIAIIIEKGEIINIFGRIRHLPEAAEKENGEYTPRAKAQQREAANFIIQSTAHDIVSRKLAQLAPFLQRQHDTYLLAEQHDAFIFECPVSIAHSLPESIQQWCKESISGVPLIVETKVLNSFEETDIYGK